MRLSACVAWAQCLCKTYFRKDNDVGTGKYSAAAKDRSTWLRLSLLSSHSPLDVVTFDARSAVPLSFAVFTELHAAGSSPTPAVRIHRCWCKLAPAQKCTVFLDGQQKRLCDADKRWNLHTLFLGQISQWPKMTGLETWDHRTTLNVFGQWGRNEEFWRPVLMSFFWCSRVSREVCFSQVDTPQSLQKWLCCATDEENYSL